MKWNEITWYSKLGAIVFFIGILPSLSFYMGIQYELTTNELAQNSSQSAISNMPEKRVDAKAEDLSLGIVSSSTIPDWNHYENKVLGVALDYPVSYGKPTLSEYDGSLYFAKEASSYLSINIYAQHTEKDGHLATAAEMLEGESPLTPVTIGGKSGLSYTSSQSGTVTIIDLGKGLVMNTTLNPNNPTDQKIISSFTFLPSIPKPDFKLNQSSQIDGIRFPGTTKVSYRITGNDVDAAGWNGIWRLTLDCPAGVSSVSYGSYISCSGISNEKQWSTLTNPAAWLQNTTDKTVQVKATAELLDKNGKVVTSSTVITDVPPSGNAFTTLQNQ